MEPDKKTAHESGGCSVCGKVPSKGIQVHYGCLSCNSCKAFFRRIHFSGPRLPAGFGYCKNDGNCNIKFGQKNCRHCRYQKCLGEGMNPKLVLSHFQVRERFKKSIEKTNVISSHVQNGEENSDGGDSLKTKPLKRAPPSFTRYLLPPFGNGYAMQCMPHKSKADFKNQVLQPVLFRPWKGCG